MVQEWVRECMKRWMDKGADEDGRRADRLILWFDVPCSLILGGDNQKYRLVTWSDHNQAIWVLQHKWVKKNNQTKKWTAYVFLYVKCYCLKPYTHICMENLLLNAYFQGNKREWSDSGAREWTAKGRRADIRQNDSVAKRKVRGTTRHLF